MANSAVTATVVDVDGGSALARFRAEASHDVDGSDMRIGAVFPQTEIGDDPATIRPGRKRVELVTGVLILPQPQTALVASRPP